MTLQSQLEQILLDLRLVSVESTMMLGAIILLVGGLVTKRAVVHKTIFGMTLVVAFYFVLAQDGAGTALSDSLVVGGEITSYVALLLLTFGLVLVFPRSGKHSVEFYFFLLSIGVGSFFMMKANSLLVMYLAIELVSLVSYLLTSFSFTSKGHEAAIKYLLFGAVSSSILLFGIGLVYGTTGTFYLSEWNFGTFDHMLSQIGLIFLIFGLFFKISIFPLHIWTPAAYQVAPVDAVAIMSIVPKIAALILLKRILVDASLASDHWIINMCLWLGITTILVGTLGALRQTNSRRMIAFGAIAHSGFLLPFSLMTGDSSEQAFWWYAVTYAIMNMGVFYLIGKHEEKGIHLNRDYSKVQNEVWVGVCFSLLLFSMVGLPPLAGFTAKFFLFSTLWEVFQVGGSGAIGIYLLVAVLATVGSLFFYLRIPYFTFLSDKNGLYTSLNKSSTSTKILATIFTIVLLLLFFVPKLIVMMHTFLTTVHE